MAMHVSKVMTREAYESKGNRQRQKRKSLILRRVVIYPAFMVYYYGPL